MRPRLESTMFFLLGFVLVLAGTSHADEHHHGVNAQEKLGQITFPTSCSPAVQKTLERGVAMIHSFWYDAAAAQFTEVTIKDPTCAIAYWGQAMATYHMGWGAPTKGELSKGFKQIEKADSLPSRTLREAAYIRTLMALYRDYDRVSDEKRLAAYAEESKKLHEAFPDDQEATAFYGHALLNSAPRDENDFATTKKAIAILQTVFDANPNHPGAAHYLIHACDNPELAKLALPAALRYAEIAPASPHALHMPSHIFARLGMWQEDIKSNLAALAAARQKSATPIGAENQIHSIHFLEYAYLQLGDYAKAHAMLDEFAKVNGASVSPGVGDYYNWARASLPSLFLLETGDWKGAAALTPPPGAEPQSEAITYWARAVGAGHMNDAAAAQRAVQQYNAMVEAVKKGEKAYVAQYMEPSGNEAQAWQDFAEGKNDEAIRLMRSVADKQDVKGKGEVELPAREMLADMLLAANRPKEALAEYEASMKIDPNRLHALSGAAHAAELAHDEVKTKEYAARLSVVVKP